MKAIKLSSSNSLEVVKMLKIGKYTFHSRLFLETGKYPNLDIQKEAGNSSDTEVLTFAGRNKKIFEPSQSTLLEKIDADQYTLLPNTAGASTAEEAVRVAKLARASGLCDMIKVEIIGCDETLLPDPVET